MAFFAGLFVMVGAMVRTGIFADLGEAAARVLDGNLFGASMALLFGSIVPSAVIDNIPFVASTSPIVSEIVASSGGIEQAQVLWWSFALGADLAGNATIIASSANVVTAVTTVLAGLYVWLRHFALA
nr:MULTISPECIES: SLC13 family permease [unclassified Streptomyces]